MVACKEERNSKKQKKTERMGKMYLGKWGKVLFFIRVKLGQEFDSIFAAILCARVHICWIIKLEATTGINMIVLGRRGAEKDFTNEIDDGVTTRPQLTYNLEFPSRFLVVCDGCLLGRLIRDESKSFTQKGDSLADDITGGENVLNVRGYGWEVIYRGRRVGGIIWAVWRIGWTGDGLRKGWGGEGWGGKGRKRGRKGESGWGKGQAILG
jgi:hypothetical protein